MAENVNLNISVSTDGGSIEHFTRVTWSISAESTEQTATFEVFMDAPPPSPAYPFIVDEAQATVMIGGAIAITGEIESRKGEGDKESYKLSFTVKSKPKKGQKSHAKLGKGQKLNTTTKTVANEIAKNGGLDISYGEDVDDDKIEQHIAVGDTTTDHEIKNIFRDRGYLVYAHHDGTIRVEGADKGDSGCDLIVGQNVMDFSAEQSSEKKRGKIKATGTLTLSKDTNRKATLTPQGIQKMKSKIEGDWVVWADGDQSAKALKKRAKYESNRRDAAGKEVSFTLFGINAPDGKPWRVNAQHYCEVPSESVFDTLRLKSISGSATKTEIKVEVTLAPINGLSNSNAGAAAPTAVRAAVKRQQKGAPLKKDQYPAPWNEQSDDIPGDPDYA
jgi:prophage tail gpP-like protein